jgi:hypothetical protein
MTTVRELFGDLTAAIEDVHSIALDGQQPDLSADMQDAMLAAVRQGLMPVHRIMLDIAAALS